MAAWGQLVVNKGAATSDKARQAATVLLDLATRLATRTGVAGLAGWSLRMRRAENGIVDASWLQTEDSKNEATGRHRLQA